MTAASQPDPVQQGQWEPIRYRFNYVPIHVALLPRGKVLAFGGSDNERENLRTPNPAELWDPHSGQLSLVDQPLTGDLFCAGHTFLADGQLLTAGGTYRF